MPRPPWSASRIHAVERGTCSTSSLRLLAQLCAEKGAFSICYRGKEAAFTLTLKKMSYRNIQGALFIVRGPEGEAVVISRDWKLAC